MNEITSSEKGVKLALKFELTQAELGVLCSRFAELKINEHYSAGLKALSLVKMVKQAIDFKFDNIVISEKQVFHHAKEAPSIDNTKARIVKGLFLTFIEYKHGLPGFFSIISGIGAAGFGIGSFEMTEIAGKLTLSDLNSFKVSPEETIKAQADFFDQTLTPENLAGFANIRSGVYCTIVAGSLIPLYASALKKAEGDNLSEVHLVQKAVQMVKEKFSPKSENLQRFTSQNLFRVIFEELFNYESTVFSIYS